MCCAESQITGSPPPLSDLDILCEMEQEGPRLIVYTMSSPGKYSREGVIFFDVLPTGELIERGRYSGGGGGGYRGNTVSTDLLSLTS